MAARGRLCAVTARRWGANRCAAGSAAPRSAASDRICGLVPTIADHEFGSRIRELRRARFRGAREQAAPYTSDTERRERPPAPSARWPRRAASRMRLHARLHKRMPRAPVSRCGFRVRELALRSPRRSGERRSLRRPLGDQAGRRWRVANSRDECRQSLTSATVPWATKVYPYAARAHRRAELTPSLLGNAGALEPAGGENRPSPCSNSAMNPYPTLHRIDHGRRTGKSPRQRRRPHVRTGLFHGCRSLRSSSFVFLLRRCRRGRRR